MSKFFDGIIPFFVGNRTQILAVLSFILNGLGVFGVIDPDTMGKINDLTLPFGAMTLAAKIDRNQRRIV